MTMSLVKDSLEEELDDSGPVEPSDTESNVEEYKYS